jgi:hypothetical protein
MIYMTDFEKAKPKIRRRMLHQSAIGGKTHFYTSIPDPLNQQYIDGKVNDTLFRLIYTLLAQSYDFWITREYLTKRFSDHTLKKYLPLVIEAKIVTVEQIVVSEGKNPANVYHTNHPDDWDMSVICDIPRTGQNFKAAPVQCCEKASDSETESTCSAAEVQAAEVQAAEVQDILNTNLTQTNLTHSHTQPAEDAKKPHQKKAEEFSERLKADHAIMSEPTILAQYLGLIGQQDRSKTLDWLEAKYPEWSLYLASRRDPRTDPALTLFNWSKFYKDPAQQRKQAGRQPQKQEMIKTDAYLTSAEDLERMLRNDCQP